MYKERESRGREREEKIEEQTGIPEQEKAAAYIYKERPYLIPVLIPLNPLANKNTAQVSMILSAWLREGEDPLYGKT